MTSLKLPWLEREQLVIGLILILAAVHGLLFVFLVPPWQHYDEPNHFEKVWLTAHLDHLPSQEDYSPKLSRLVLKSMIAHNFYRAPATAPVIGSPAEKIRIPGYSQLSEPPLYYLVASLPLHLIPNRSIEAQLYAVRLVSLLFFLLTVLSGYGIACELTPKRHALRWMLPFSLALLPGLADLMTAVNDDVAAIAVASVFLFLSVRLICQGFSWVDFLALILTIPLIILSKNTAMVVLISLPFSLLFSIFRGKRRRIAWISSFLLLLTAAAVTIRWDDAFGWYRNTSQPGPSRVRSELAPWGKYAFSIETAFVSAPRGFPLVYQNMPVKIARDLAGKQVTFGGWIWTQKSTLIGNPIALRTVAGSFSETLAVDQTPRFHAWTVTIPEGTTRIWLDLNPVPDQAASQIFYDGLLLVEGAFPASELPEMDSSDAKTGTWSGQTFENLLLNSSAETAGPRASPLIDSLGVRFLPDSTHPSLILASLVDRRGTQNIYPLTARHLFQTFWGRFGWGHVPLIGEDVIYTILFIITLLMLVFAAIRALSRAARTRWEVIFILGLVTLFSILMTLTRAIVYLSGPRFYIATARYFYPVVVPLMLAFSTGWLEVCSWSSGLGSRFCPGKNSGQEAVSAGMDRPISIGYFSFFFGFFLCISVLSLFSIIRFYFK